MNRFKELSELKKNTTNQYFNVHDYAPKSGLSKAERIERKILKRCLV